MSKQCFNWLYIFLITDHQQRYKCAHQCTRIAAFKPFHRSAPQFLRAVGDGFNHVSHTLTIVLNQKRRR